MWYSNQMAKFFSIKGDGVRPALIAQNEERNANMLAQRSCAWSSICWSHTFLLPLEGIRPQGSSWGTDNWGLGWRPPPSTPRAARAASHAAAVDGTHCPRCSPQHTTINSGCLTVSGEIVRQGIFTQHHRKKRPKIRSLSDRAALNIVFPFSLLEQTQNGTANYLRLACKVVALGTGRCEPLGAWPVLAGRNPEAWAVPRGLFLRSSAAYSSWARPGQTLKPSSCQTVSTNKRI